MISAVTKTSRACIDEIKPQVTFLSYEILKKLENLAKNAFSTFCSIHGKFLEQTPL